jgi:hypothetical protein
MNPSWLPMAVMRSPFSTQSLLEGTGILKAIAVSNL